MPEIALVTGGAGEIGSEVVRRLGARGARVLVVDRAQAIVEAVAGLRSEGLDVEAVALDVASPAGWEHALAGVGHLDVVVNAAGVEGRSGPLWEQAPEDFETVMRVNATGTFLALRATLPLLRGRDGAAVVNIASTAGILGLPGLSPYVASKHAVVGLTRAAATEAARWGIRVNAVCPGPTEGRMISSIEQGVRPGDPALVRERYEAAIPFKRYASPGEVADVVVYLTSPASSYVTGAIVPVDGGMSAI